MDYSKVSEWYEKFLPFPFPFTISTLNLFLILGSPNTIAVQKYNFKTLELYHLRHKLHSILLHCFVRLRSRAGDRVLTDALSYCT